VDWSRILHANEQLEYQLFGVVRETHATQGDAAIRWRAGVYPFDHESVANVAAELSRYTEIPIHVEPDLADKRIGGALDIRNVKDSIWDLQDIGPIRVREHNGGFTLEYRAEPDSKKN
jgi:ferric-dicitrate binding protein FerR (iron transport regulator)